MVRSRAGTAGGSLHLTPTNTAKGSPIYIRHFVRLFNPTRLRSAALTFCAYLHYIQGAKASSPGAFERLPDPVDEATASALLGKCFDRADWETISGGSGKVAKDTFITTVSVRNHAPSLRCFLEFWRLDELTELLLELGKGRSCSSRFVTRPFHDEWLVIRQKSGGVGRGYLTPLCAINALIVRRAFVYTHIH